MATHPIKTILCLDGAGVPSRSADSLLHGLTTALKAYPVRVETVAVHELGLPFFEYRPEALPLAVQRWLTLVTGADAFVWLTPLYHGSYAGRLKSALDWLEYLRPQGYLQDKYVGLVAYSDGQQAMQAILGLEHVAHALRAWTLPYSVPVQQVSTHIDKATGVLAPALQARLALLSRELVRALRLPAEVEVPSAASPLTP